MEFAPLLFLLGSFFVGVLVGDRNACLEKQARSCGECMQVPGCGWCEDPSFGNNPSIILSRCDLPENLLASACPNVALINPESEALAAENLPHSSGGPDIGKATQLRPQTISVKLRPGEAVKIDLSYKQVEPFPVDLYFLIDLSSSMNDNLESLRNLGRNLAEAMPSITRDFRLGLGSVMGQMQSCDGFNPCNTTTYSFSNDLSLSSSIDTFVDAVDAVNQTSNLDGPKVGFDAMVQAAVCEVEINWRAYAARLLVYVSDATFLESGAGNLSSILMPSDVSCHLDDKGRYFKNSEADYLSIELLVQKMKAYYIRPIFAVTKEVIAGYKDLEKLIPASAVGELKEDASNIVTLVRKAYNSLVSQVALDPDLPEGIDVVNKESRCMNGNELGLRCADVKVGDVVNFTLNIKADHCFDGRKQMKISTVGTGDEVSVIISMLCNCQCKSTVESSSNCSGHGTYECGTCVCDFDHLGPDCSCSKEDFVTAEEYLQNCVQPGDFSVCNNRGNCLCGQCNCVQFPGRRTYGRYCECNDAFCERLNGKMCNGRGVCICGECQCEEGWSGPACGCTSNASACIDPHFPQSGICSGFGICRCGHCICESGRFGAYCQISPLQLCMTHKPCVQCMHFGDRKEYEQNLTMCGAVCRNYKVRLLHGTVSRLAGSCRALDDVTQCVYEFWYETNRETILIDTDPNTQVCPISHFHTSSLMPVRMDHSNPTSTFKATPYYIIIGIKLAIICIVLILALVWKFFASTNQTKNTTSGGHRSRILEEGDDPLIKSATSPL